MSIRQFRWSITAALTLASISVLASLASAENNEIALRAIAPIREHHGCAGRHTRM